MSPSGTEAELRRAFSMFPSGVAAVCALGIDGEPVGMAMSSFTGVSLDPPLVSVCVDRGSTTWPRLAALPQLGISVLGGGHGAVCRSLSRRDGDRFEGVPWHSTDGGSVLIEESSLWLECRIYRQIAAGDHFLILLEALDLVPHDSTPPLVFHRSDLRALVG